jgi:hypothetical protein
MALRRTGDQMMHVRKIALTAVLILVGVSLACSGGSPRDVVLGPTGPGSSDLTAPTPQSPISDVQLNTLRPTFVVVNGSSPSGTRTYEFQVSDRTDFLVTTAQRSGVAEGSGTTSFTPDADLAPSTRMYWRARIVQGGNTSAWSTTAQFRTRLGGYNRPGELYDPLIFGETIGTRAGSTTFMGTRGIRVDDPNSWVRYQLATTLTSGEISVEVEGLAPNRPSEKARIFSMMDGGNRLFDSLYLFNVQYRGIPGNPDNAISYKLLMGSSDLKYEPDFGQRAEGVRSLNPGTTYLWTATWGSTFRLTVREGGATGPVIYDRSHVTPGTYNPTPHTVYLGANDANIESGSFAGAIYRNLWVGSGPRPASLGSALDKR